MSKNSQFEKFINKTRGSAIKEQIKQEKKAAKKERAQAIEKRFEEKRRARAGGSEAQSGAGNREPGNSRKAGVGNQEPGNSRKSEVRGREPGKSRKSGVGSQEPVAGRQPGAASREPGAGRKSGGASRQSEPARQQPAIGSQKPADKSQPQAGNMEPRTGSTNNPGGVRKISTAGKVSPSNSGEGVQMPLNKYIAHSGISGRREAAELVKSGEVTVNGEVVTEPGTKISDTDVVKIKGRKITPSKSFVYILLNKPKDYITTTDDPFQRKTVLDLIRNATTERVYPIGRLDRNTSGVLLFTNDGELAQTLSHPKNEIKKIYEVRLDRDLTKNDFEQLLKGLTLEDGFIAPDALAYADTKDKSVIGIEIHSGRNRIVRRIFEKLGYDVRGLDRVMYAGLTKKNVQRGKWRFLSEREIRILKHFNKAGAKAH